MRIAVLGCGSIGRRHIRNLQSLGLADVVAFDPVPSAQEEIVRCFGVDCYASLDALWAQHPDIAFITAPSNMHVPLASQAAYHNCHLFIEKPLSHSLDGLDVLARETQGRNLVTMVGCNMRFHPGPTQVKAWLDEGVVGTVLAARIRTGSYLPRWRPQQDYRRSYSASLEWGGAVLDCIHEIDLALWLLGDAKLGAAVIRPARSLGLETDGLAELVLEHTGGTVSNVHLNFVQRNYRRTIEVIGSEGTVEWDYTAGRVDRHGPDGGLAISVSQPAAWEANKMYLEEIDYFLSRVRDGKDTCNPVASAARTLELALEARTL